MKHLMIAFALALSLVTLPARAEDKVTIADCGDSGCACYLSNYSANEIAVVLGVDPPAGEGTATLVHAGGDYFWTRAPLAEIDLAYGGKGECPLVARLCP